MVQTYAGELDHRYAIHSHLNGVKPIPNLHVQIKKIQVIVCIISLYVLGYDRGYLFTGNLAKGCNMQKQQGYLAIEMYVSSSNDNWVPW